MTQADLLEKQATKDLQAGQLVEALRLRTEEAGLRSRLAKDEGRRWETDGALLRALAHLGTLAMDLGHLDQAEEALLQVERGTAFNRKAYPGKDTDEFWEAIRNRLGRLTLLRGDADGASRIFAEVLERRRRILAPTRRDESQSYGIAVSLGFLARTRLAQGKRDEALVLAEEALAKISRIVAGADVTDCIQMEVASAFLLLHTLKGNTADLDQAREILMRYAEKGERGDKFWRLAREAELTELLPSDEVKL